VLNTIGIGPCAILKGVLTPLRLNALTFICAVHVFTAGVLILRSSRLVPLRAVAPRIAFSRREDP
jgi:hypothetical protein